jgi:hypothetical protein
MIEMSQSRVKDSLRAVYNRAVYLKQRREMMQWWSDYIEEAAGNTPLRAEPKRKSRGGKREGAGRKAEITFDRRLALANEVTLLQQADPKLSVKGAIDELVAQGKVRLYTRTKYLTPKYIDKSIMAVLKESKDRSGILAALPVLSEDKPL